MSMIHLQGVCLAYANTANKLHATCLQDVDASLDWGQRLAIAGDNGSGKSTLLKLLLGTLAPDAGCIRRADGLRIGYVPQLLTAQDGLSGGQTVNQALSHALAGQPDLLLLDEPTNHLDAANRKSLAKMLRHFYGALVIVTHDRVLLDEVCDTVWTLERGALHIFNGRYADFLAERDMQRLKLEQQLLTIRREQHAAHDARMQEQQRAAKARERGANSIAQRKWATIRSPAKLGRGNTTAGRKEAAIATQQRDLADQLAAMSRPEIIVPRFQLSAATAHQTMVVQVSGGCVGYDSGSSGGQALLRDIYLTLEVGGRLALVGANGSGKSTLAKAIAGIAPVQRLAGEWSAPPRDRIGYLDQHYAGFTAGMTVLETLARAQPAWTLEQRRRWLADFLFRRDEAVQADVATLSGGEQARLSLACIAACPPELLVLDEMTNNLDATARQHVIEVLRNYSGAMLLISHDEDFLEAVGRVERFAM